MHYTYYSLYEIPAIPVPTANPFPIHVAPTVNAAAFPNSTSRSLPIFSVDSGLIYERATHAFGQEVTQTLEPRFYYVYIPFRDQDQIPLFDTAIADFNYAQIFSENMFSGGDRINDARQLTAAVSSRMLLPSSGQEVLRGTFGQRYYFRDQRVTLTPSDTPRTYNASNWLAALSGRVSEHWTLEGASEYDQRDYRTERLTVAARYRPEGLKALNLSYRYLSGDITQTGPLKQVDLSAQWLIAGRWYGVGRFNYSLVDSRIVEGIGGLEYGADCWTSRIIVQRFALPGGTSSSSPTSRQRCGASTTRPSRSSGWPGIGSCRCRSASPHARRRPRSSAWWIRSSGCASEGSSTRWWSSMPAPATARPGSPPAGAPRCTTSARFCPSSAPSWARATRCGAH